MWLHMPESCHSAADAEPLTSRSDSRLKKLARFATWKGRLLPSLSWWRACKKEAWMMRLCGRILPLLTAELGVVSWMESLAAGRVRISAAQDHERVSQESDQVSGITSDELSKRSAHRGVSLRMSVPFCQLTAGTWRSIQRSLWSEHSEPFCETWPSSGSMLSGACFEHLTSELRIVEQDGGAWPTPTVADQRGMKRNLNPIERAIKCGRTGSESAFMNLNEYAEAWPEMWGTPRVANNDGIGTIREDVFDSYGIKNLRTNAKAGAPSLAHLTEWPSYPTPTAQSYGTNQSKSEGAQIRPSLETWCRSFPLEEPTGKDGAECSNDRPGSDQQWLKELMNVPGTKHLNPYFVDWMMGLPLHWTLPEPIESGQQETRSYLLRLRQRLDCLLGGNR